MAARFATTSEEDRDKIIDNAVPANTKRATNTWVRAFSSYCQLDLKTCSATEFAKKLEGFYADLRKQNGETYKRSSYIAARGALHRHVTSLGRTFSIFNDKEFAKANSVLDGVLKENKKTGKEQSVEHKDPLTAADWDRLMEYFKGVDTTDDPILLCRYVWFCVTLHFCLRGREVQCQMLKTDLVFTKDENGFEIIQLSKDFASKNHQGGLTGTAFTSTGIIQAVLGSPQSKLRSTLSTCQSKL